MKRVIFYLLFLILVGLLTYRIGIQFIPRQKNVQPIWIGNQKLSVEVARTAGELSRGLGNRDSIGSDGMLFVLPMRMVPSFWMKDMRFGLDFVWIEARKIVALTSDVPAEPGVPDALLKIYSPGLSADHVLELPKGDIQERGLKVGLDITYSPGVH